MSVHIWLVFKHHIFYQNILYILVLVSLFSGTWCYINNKTVNIGVIMGNFDTTEVFRHHINISVNTAMTTTNSTKHVKMNPVFMETNLTDSFSLSNSICNLISNNTIAVILGSTRQDTFSIIESYSQALQLPFFIPTLTKEATVNRTNFIISMCPSFIPAVVDFIDYFNWNTVFYLFDSDDALWRLQSLYEAFSHRRVDLRKKPFHIVAIRIPEVRNCREVLRKLDRTYSYINKRIVVDLSTTEDYHSFLSQIIDVGMNRDGYHYVLGTLDMLRINSSIWRSFTFGGVNITGFQFVKQTGHTLKMGELFGLTKGELPSLEAALTVDSIAILTTALVSLVSETDRKCLDKLRFQRGHLFSNMSCTDPTKSLELGDKIFKCIVQVQASNQMTGPVALDRFGHRKDYVLDVHHLNYRSTLRQSSPFVMKKESSEKGKPAVGNDRWEGYCIDMMKMIAEMCNFTYIIKEVADEQYGTKYPGDGWSGMIGEIINGTADMALSSLSITHKREEAVYFTKPFMNTGISIMIKKPEREKPGVFSFMDPLSLAVWSCIIAGFFAVSFILYMVGRFSPYEWQEESNGATTLAPSDTFSFINTLWFSLGALMQQGPDIFPRSLSGRVLASAWWFFTLITISSYTANLAAFLTFERLNTPINSVDDLVAQTKIKYGTQRSGSTHDFFKESNVTIYKNMYQVMTETTPDIWANGSEEGWQRVIKGLGKYAYLMESASNNYYNQRKPCKTMKVGRNLDRKGYGIALPKYSKLRQTVNIAVLELQERGDLLKLEQKWWYSKGQCGNADSGEKGKNALNLSNVSGVFHILIGGLVLAMVISLSQIIFYSKMKRRNNTDQYRVNTNGNSNHPEVRYQRPARRVTKDNPVITCTTSNGGDRHLISFDDDKSCRNNYSRDVTNLNENEVT